MNIPPRLFFLVVLIPTIGAPHVAAQEEESGRLTLERIYQENDFEAKSADGRWLDDGSGYVTLEPAGEGSDGQDVVRHDRATGEKEILVHADDLTPPGEGAPLSIEDYSFSEGMSHLLIYTNSKRVWRANTRGDYWLYDRSSHELRQLGGDDAAPSSLMFATFSPAGRHVAYVRENNIYVESVREPKVRAVTTDGSDTLINGTFDWVYEEELSLRNGIRWSPDGERLAFWQINSEGARVFPLINNTDSLYPKITPIPYPKTGQRNSACRVGVVPVEGGDVFWLPVPGDTRNHYIARMDWAGPDEIVLQQLNRLQNTNRVMLWNASGMRTGLTETDDAWVNVHDEMYWLGDGERFTWVSERDGWRHVYLVSRDDGSVEQLTKGEFDVISLITVDEERRIAYFTASPENPTQQYLYRINLDGTGMRRLSPEGQSGTHSYSISPDCEYAFHTYSDINTPPVTALITLTDHEPVRVLEDNGELREKLVKLELRPTEFLRVDVGDGVYLDGWCIKPPDFDARKKYPLFVHVYGEPAGTTVNDRWSSRHHLWHLMLAQQGYVVMSFDNRGTPAPRGRDWRKSIYRQVGTLAARDQAEAVKVLLEECEFLDPDRVGVWGWSGGGSMTLNAMLKYPDIYKVGISVAPVPNMRLYDTIYQERYMGLPNDNVEGYRNGSPLNFAHQLKGDLLLIHGTADDNVHYQGTEALVNRFIRHNKQFSMMSYPNRTHSIREGKNTTLHLRTLMTNYLMEKLPPGPR